MPGISDGRDVGLELGLPEGRALDPEGFRLGNDDGLDEGIELGLAGGSRSVEFLAIGFELGRADGLTLGMSEGRALDPVVMAEGFSLG